MNEIELIEHFEHIRYQIVGFEIDTKSPLPTSVGSGFILEHNGEYIFVTADHVANTHDNGVRILNKNICIQTNRCKQDANGIWSVELVPLGGITFMSSYKVDIDKGIVSEQPLFDAAFVVLNGSAKSACYVTLEINLNGAHVNCGDAKSRITSDHIIEAKAEDIYSVFGRVQFKLEKSGNQNLLLSTPMFHTNLKYICDQGDYYVLKYDKPVIVDEWKGLSGSPVINTDGELIGIACSVNDIQNLVFVKKMKRVLTLIDADILTSQINKQNSI